ncbi:MAG TPA: type II toxin-antitoxin system HicB family antitoxin [Ktedonobacterales bacterium]|nr:type II toxin-antitoxin system HicB family antitoxin [Ktedonobacterales bacterium]
MSKRKDSERQSQASKMAVDENMQASSEQVDSDEEAVEVSAEPTEEEPVSAATYDVYLEEAPNGATLALILDLPGCFASGASRQEALEHLQQALTDYHAWLRLHDDYTPEVHGPFVFETKEIFQITYDGEDEINSFFTPDAEPATDEDIEWALALMGWQREDVLERVSSLSDETLDWKPEHDPDALSIRELLDHIAQAEIWYMGRLDEKPPRIVVADLPGPTLERFQRVRQAAVMRVKTYPKEWRGKVFTHLGEQWSLRKALRRAVWHERDHLNQINDVLAAYRASQ